jgi:hypothetical protein
MDYRDLSIKELYEKILSPEGHKYEGKDFIVLKDLKKELERRKLPEPIPVKMAPRLILVKKVFVEPKKSKVDLILPDSVKESISQSDNLWDMFYNHPNQGIVVAMSDMIEWKDIYVGATVYMHEERGKTPIFRYKDEDYGIVTYASMVAVK